MAHLFIVPACLVMLCRMHLLDCAFQQWINTSLCNAPENFITIFINNCHYRQTKTQQAEQIARKLPLIVGHQIPQLLNTILDQLPVPGPRPTFFTRPGSFSVVLSWFWWILQLLKTWTFWWKMCRHPLLQLAINLIYGVKW